MCCDSDEVHVDSMYDALLPAEQLELKWFEAKYRAYNKALVKDYLSKNPPTCMVCNKKFKSMSALNKHKRAKYHYDMVELMMNETFKAYAESLVKDMMGIPFGQRLESVEKRRGVMKTDYRPTGNQVMLNSLKLKSLWGSDED